MSRPEESLDLAGSIGLEAAAGNAAAPITGMKIALNYDGAFFKAPVEGKTPGEAPGDRVLNEESPSNGGGWIWNPIQSTKNWRI